MSHPPRFWAGAESNLFEVSLFVRNAVLLDSALAPGLRVGNNIQVETFSPTVDAPVSKQMHSKGAN